MMERQTMGIWLSPKAHAGRQRTHQQPTAPGVLKCSPSPPDATRPFLCR